jgi:hypothetical protein
MSASERWERSLRVRAPSEVVLLGDVAETAEPDVRPLVAQAVKNRQLPERRRR